MKEKKKITAVVSKRYRAADRKGKTKIPGEFVATTGYNRRYAIGILKNHGRTVSGTVDGKPVKYKAGKPCKARKNAKGGGRPKKYGDEVIAAVSRIW
ncbi:MAG: transposase, partial [Treponema sp.]|nr:transposase [Treponema sp.]